MTSEEWDTHYWRIRLDLVRGGSCLADAALIAERDAVAEFGPRPGEAASHER